MDLVVSSEILPSGYPPVSYLVKANESLKELSLMVCLTSRAKLNLPILVLSVMYS